MKMEALSTNERLALLRSTTSERERLWAIMYILKWIPLAEKLQLVESLIRERIAELDDAIKLVEATFINGEG